jgi:F420-dependent oxidoreductase-like protein
MRFSIWTSPQHSWQEVVGLVQHCEATGWDGAYFADHFMPNTLDGAPDDGPTLECWAVMAALAVSTERLRLGTLVCGNTYRHPAVLAKIASTTDQISGGRLLLGLGAGWQVNEHRAYGIDLFDVPTRLDRFEEACAVVTSLLAQPRTTFAGKHYELHDAPCQPGPVSGHLPLLVGGGGEKRTLRVAAKYADEWNVWSTPELFAQKSAVLDQRCAEIDRDPATIVRSTQALLFLSDDESWLESRRGKDIGMPSIVGTPNEVVDIVGRYAEAGVDELIVPDFSLGSPERRVETCDRFINEVAPSFR